MAGEDTTQATQAPQIAAPDISSGAPPTAPDLSALTQPGNSAQPNAQTAAMGSAQDALSKAGANYQAASDLAAKPVPTPTPIRHETLYRMVEALGVSLSAGAKSMATRGEAGGASDVQAYYQNKQNSAIQAQNARQQQHDSAVRSQLMAGEANEQMGRSYMLLSTFPNDMRESDMRLQAGQLGLNERTQALKIQLADFQKQNFGFSPDEITGGTQPGAAPTTVNPQHMATAKSMLTRSVGPDSAAGAILGNDDPAIAAVQKVIADPNATPQQIQSAGQGLSFAISQREAGTAARTKQSESITAQQNADPLFKWGQPEELAKPGVQAALQSYIDNPANAKNFNGIAQARMLIAKANIAQQHDVQLAAQKAQANKNAEQVATAGDPNVSGQMLYDGTLTLADLKSRGSTPKQITDTVSAAQRIAAANGGKYNASDEIVGEKSLSEPGNQVFFGSARSLVQGGGMLDQLKAAHDALGNTKIPSYNTVKDWRDYQAGQPQLATYRAAVLATADDAAKVMGAGTPTDALRDEFLQVFQNNLNNLGFAGAIEQSRSGIRSQVTGRIGPNRYIQQREGDILAGGDRGINFAAPVGATGKARGSDGNMYWHDARGNILAPAPAGN